MSNHAGGKYLAWTKQWRTWHSIRDATEPRKEPPYALFVHFNPMLALILTVDGKKL